MSADLPSYQQACLAPDTRNSAVYLVGGANSVSGMLEVNYVSLTNINAPTTRRTGTNTDALRWSAGAPKACYAAPSSAQANSVIKVVQFGQGTSYMGFISPGGAIADPSSFTDLEFQSPKLFSWVGSFTGSNYNVFHMYAVKAIASSASHWSALRLSFLNSGGSLADADTKMYPSSADPLLSVGTFTTASVGNSRGYSVIFDKQGGGQVFSATGSDQATANNTIPVLILANPTSVNMNGIVLSSDAVSVTMGETGYILDKAKGASTTVLYSITPGTSSTLQQVPNKGSAPVFFPTIAVTALNKQIVVYSAPPSGTPYFSSYDTATQTWSGVNLITSDTTEDSKAPIGAIIGGVVGGLVLIALMVFFVRRRRTPKYQAATTSVANTEAHAPPPPPPPPHPAAGGMTQIQNGGPIVPIQGQIFQTQHQQQQQQPTFTYQPPVFDPYAQVQKPDEHQYVPYQAPTKFFDPYGGNQNGTPGLLPAANYDTNASQTSPTIYSVSPYASPVPLRTEPNLQQQHYSPVQQEQHYSPVQQQQQQQQQHQQQQQQHYSPEQPFVQSATPGAQLPKSPQFIPPPQ